MVELIAMMILIVSVLGMGIIVIRKIPVLVKLSPPEISQPGLLAKFRNRIKKNNRFKSFSSGILLQKILSRVRVLSLRAERKTSSWLGQLRQRSLRQRFSQKGVLDKKTLNDGGSLIKFSESYWQELKKAKRSNRQRAGRKKLEKE